MMVTEVYDITVCLRFQGFKRVKLLGLNNSHRPRWRHLVLSTPTGALSLAVPLVRGALVLVGYCSAGDLSNFFFPAGFATHHSGGAVVAAFALSSANAQKEIVFKFSTCRMLCDAWEMSQV